MSVCLKICFSEKGIALLFFKFLSFSIFLKIKSPEIVFYSPNSFTTESISQLLEAEIGTQLQSPVLIQANLPDHDLN